MNEENLGRPVEPELFNEIQRFLADEAALLDRLAYKKWFALMTGNISYRVTTQVFRYRQDGVQDHAIIDEDFDALGRRVDQLTDPKLTLAENPASLVRRFVSNIRADHGEGPDNFIVEANMMVYRNRPSNGNIQLYAGERRDVLHRVDGKLRIAARLVRLDQTVLEGGTLNILL